MFLSLAAVLHNSAGPAEPRPPAQDQDQSEGFPPTPRPTHHWDWHFEARTEPTTIYVTCLRLWWPRVGCHCASLGSSLKDPSPFTSTCHDSVTLAAAGCFSPTAQSASRSEHCSAQFAVCRPSSAQRDWHWPTLLCVQPDKAHRGGAHHHQPSVCAEPTCGTLRCRMPRPATPSSADRTVVEVLCGQQ